MNTFLVTESPVTNISNASHSETNSNSVSQPSTQTIENVATESYNDNDVIHTMEDEEGYCLLEVDWDGDDDNIIVLDDDDEENAGNVGTSSTTSSDRIRYKS